MTQSKNWIIYEHISPSGKIYVGVTSYSVAIRWGTNGNKYLSKSNNRYLHPIFAKAILKYGWNNFKHIIIASNLGEMTAKNMEKDLIAFNKAKGISYNITDGGDGRLGCHFNHSEKSKQLIRLHHRRHQTQETKVKISQKQLGVKFPDWRKELLSKAHNKEKIKVAQYSLEGKLLNVFDSIMQAEKVTQINNGNISAVIRGKGKTAGGYMWKRIN